MKKRELFKLGLGGREASALAFEGIRAAAAAGWKKPAMRARLVELTEAPADFADDEFFGSLAAWLTQRKDDPTVGFKPRETPARYESWGVDLESQAVAQMATACRLPIAVRGALMPDAHLGYGLPIGGVLAVRAAVIPYAVGVDIACRMKLTVLDLPATALRGQRDRLRNVLEAETRFGMGSAFRDRRQHPVLDDDWSVSPITKQVKDKAWNQLGTSGSGNHFVEFGTLEVFEDPSGAAPAAPAPSTSSTVDDGSGTSHFELEPGTYLALLSHSGSRGPGAMVAGHYSRLAMDLHSDLPPALKRLAWLALDTQEGAEYWAAMQLMGRYAAANHAMIHRHIAKALGARVVADVENHHNFAWEEEHAVEGGSAEGAKRERLIVHRKGATPAARGVLGVIPGSMASPAYVVRGLGQPDSLESASHGAGRVMSRTQATKTFTWSDTKKLLADRGVELLSAGLDEVPGAYRDIDQVMAAQRDLVEPLARFFPRIVKMAPAKEGKRRR